MQSYDIQRHNMQRHHVQRHIPAIIIGSILLWSGSAWAHRFMVEQYETYGQMKGLLSILLFTFLVEYLINQWVFDKPKYSLLISIAALILSSLCAALLLPFSGFIVVAIGMPALILFVVLLSCIFMVVVKLIVYHVIFKLPASNIAFSAIFVTSTLATSLWHYLPPYFR